MPIEPALTPPTQALPDTPAPKKTSGVPKVQPKQTSAPDHELEILFSPLAPHTAIPSIRFQSATDHDCDAVSAVHKSGEPEDEYTLCAYGDISLSEVVVPPLPAPAHTSPGPLQPRSPQPQPQPRLRLKVQRPPMPKRRTSYTYFPDPLPHSGGMDPDERWPGSPRPFANSPPWLQHQPLASPLPVDPTTSRTQGNKPVKNSGSSLEKLFDELVPAPPSIRLSPPGSPTSQALSLPQEIHEQKGGVRSAVKVDDAAKLPLPFPTPASRKEVPWRTRLPPRLPIPKWDM